jgi:hypothetical protein
MNMKIMLECGSTAGVAWVGLQRITRWPDPTEESDLSAVAAWGIHQQQASILCNAICSRSTGMQILT